MCSCPLEYVITGLLNEVQLECRSVCAQEIKTLYTSTKVACNAYLRMLALKYLKKLLNRSLSSEEQGASSFLLSSPNECHVAALSCLHILLHLEL